MSACIRLRSYFDSRSPASVGICANCRRPISEHADEPCTGSGFVNGYCPRCAQPASKHLDGIARDFQMLQDGWLQKLEPHCTGMRSTDKLQMLSLAFDAYAFAKLRGADEAAARAVADRVVVSIAMGWTS